MARAVYSTVLYRGMPDPGVSGLYLCPEGYTTVVRDIQVISPKVLADLPDFFIVYDSASGARVFSITSPYVDYYRQYQWEGRAVFNAGDLIECNAANGDWWLYMSGYLLTLP